MSEPTNDFRQSLGTISGGVDEALSFATKGRLVTGSPRERQSRQFPIGLGASADESRRLLAVRTGGRNGKEDVFRGVQDSLQ